MNSLPNPYASSFDNEYNPKYNLSPQPDLEEDYDYVNAEGIIQFDKQ